MTLLRPVHGTLPAAHVDEGAAAALALADVGETAAAAFFVDVFFAADVCLFAAAFLLVAAFVLAALLVAALVVVAFVVVSFVVVFEVVCKVVCEVGELVVTGTDGDVDGAATDAVADTVAAVDATTEMEETFEDPESAWPTPDEPALEGQPEGILIGN